jgi:hypothetical protein
MLSAMTNDEVIAAFGDLSSIERDAFEEGWWLRARDLVLDGYSPDEIAEHRQVAMACWMAAAPRCAPGTRRPTRVIPRNKTPPRSRWRFPVWETSTARIYTSVETFGLVDGYTPTYVGIGVSVRTRPGLPPCRGGPRHLSSPPLPHRKS